MNIDKPFTFDRVTRVVLVVLCIVGGILLVDYLSGVLLPFLVACVFAYMLNPMVEFNCRMLRMKNRVLPTVLTLFEIAMVVTVAVYIVYPLIVSEVAELVEMMRQYNEINTNGKYLSESIHEFIRENVNIEDISKYLTREQLVNVVTATANKTWSFVGSTLSVVFAVLGWLVVLLYLIFLLIDYPKIKNGFQKAIPPRFKNTVWQVMQDVGTVVERYFRGQSLIALIVGILYSIGFVVVGLPLGLVFGLFVGVLNLVPYLQVVSFPVALVLCLVDSITTGGNFWVMLLEVAIVYIVVQIIQDMFITPKIMGKQMGINPVFVFLSLSVWGVLLGFIGLIVALPLTALIISYYKRYVLQDTSDSIAKEDENESENGD
ncbi:MAG: AI-2E family transporter [Muribaculaceae bacterium]|jgi:predicted PurR-regulated permease PerM|nr:AI-2E family transporter [Muribaculaceae bacterium]MEE1338897.1 AI-2E family transporter [Muribaculaceae bacterium]